MKKHVVAYVIVVWNNRDLIDECIQSIKEQEGVERYIVVVDNASSDGSADYIRQRYPFVVLVQNRSNLGFTGGNNIGIEKALENESVEYVALVNSDATLDPEWSRLIVNFAEAKPKAALLQGTTLDYYDHGTVDSYYIFMSENGQATQAGWRESYIGELGPLRVFGVNAAACMITKRFITSQPFKVKQFFDERFFMYLEDVDVAARATILGWDSYLVDKARAYHMGSASSGKNPGFSLYMTFRNNSAVIFKNFSVGVAFKYFKQIPRSDYHTFRHLRRLGRRKDAWLIIKGRIVGLLRLPLYILSRRKLQRRRSSASPIITRKYLSRIDKI